MAKIKNGQKLTSAELVEVLNYIIKNNQELQKMGQVPIAAELIGEAGLGKTSLIEQVAKLNGLRLVKLNLAQIEELGDLVGFPLRQFQMCKEDDKSICLWVDEHAVESYEKQGYIFTGQKQMSYCPPSWIADASEGGILLLDDYTRADPRFIQACMELIDRQKYISWDLPKNWHIILTSNPDNGEYLVNAMDDAQKTRYVSFEMKFDPKGWALWAEFEGIDERCINFMLHYGEEIINGIGVGDSKSGKKSRTNPRSLVKFFNSLRGIEDFEKEITLVKMLGEGSVGDYTSDLFVQFITKRLDKLVSPDFIMSEKYDKVKDALLDCCGDIHSSKEKTAYKPAIASLLTSRLINYSLVKAHKNEVDKKYVTRIIDLVKDKVFGQDLTYNLVKQVYSAESSKFKDLTLDSTVAKIILG